MPLKSMQKKKSPSAKSTGKKGAKKSKKESLYLAMSPETKIWFVEKVNGKEVVTEIPNEVVLQCILDVLTRAVDGVLEKAEKLSKTDKPAHAPGNNCSDCSTPCSGNHEPQSDPQSKPKGQIVAKQPKFRKTDN